MANEMFIHFYHNKKRRSSKQTVGGIFRLLI